MRKDTNDVLVGRRNGRAKDLAVQKMLTTSLVDHGLFESRSMVSNRSRFSCALTPLRLDMLKSFALRVGCLERRKVIVLYFQGCFFCVTTVIDSAYSPRR